MDRWVVTPKFRKAFKALGHKQQERAEKSLRLFNDNPHHPSLNFEKLSGTSYLTIRVDKNFRIVMRDAGAGKFELVDVGNHNYVYRGYA